MKHWKLAIALVCFGSSAFANPYFRMANPQNGQTKKFFGASIDPLSPGKSSAISELALITHSKADGCFLPSVVCEDWSPLAIGPSYNAGKFAVVFGPVANLAPVVKTGIRMLAQSLPSSANQQAVVDALSSQDDSIVMAFGPQLWVNPLRDGKFMPVNAWQPAGRIFVGLAVKF